MEEHLVKKDESAHWYTTDEQGNPIPRHTYTNTKGGTSNVTLREARKENLFPSVTSIKKLIANEGLDRWKQEQWLSACYDHPKLPNESKLDYARRIQPLAQEKTREAAEFGSAIHREIENFNRNQSYHINGALLPFVQGYITWFYENVEKVISAERVVVCPTLGVAGTIDIEYIHKYKGHRLADIKTQNVKLKKGVPTPSFYDEWIEQLGGYSHMLYENGAVDEAPMCDSIVIDSNEPRPVWVKEWDEEKYEWGVESFLAMLQLWRIKKKYDPRNP